MSQPQTHYRTCNLCEAMCGIVIKHQDAEIISIKGDENDHFSKGYICPKAIALQDVYNDPDRLKKPIKKVNGTWEEISWDQAFNEVAAGLKNVKEKYGNNALSIYQGNPSVHNYGTSLFSGDLARALRTKNKFSATSVDQLPHHFAANFMFGHALLIPIPDIDRTDFFLVIGANPMISNGSLMTAAGMPRRIKALQERGGEMVVIDPVKTKTAQAADQHLFIKPGSDVMLLFGLLKVLLDENLTYQNKVKHARGLEKLREKLEKMNLDQISLHTGIPSVEIKMLAKRFAEAKSAVCYGRMGVSVQRHGSLCQYLINCINIVTGNFDQHGGALFTTPALDIVKSLGPSAHKFNRWQSRVSGLPEFGGELPVSALSDEILTEGEGQIKALITSAGNPALSTPNGQRLEKALSKLDYMVSIDIYLNETTKHADIILPPATGLETDHFDLIFNLFAVRNTVKFSEALFEPEKGSRYDWEIYKELTRRLSKPKGLMAKLFFNWKTPKKLLNLGLKQGPYGGWFSGINLRKLKKHPHGIDLGPLQSQLPERLYTNDQKIELAPEILINELMPAYNSFQAQNGSEYDLQMISRRQLRSNNSWMHNIHRLTRGPKRCTVLMHPEDAAVRSLNTDEMVEVVSVVGSVKLPVEITEDIMPGVISIPHGWGHHRSDIRMKNAEENAGVSINDLTDHKQLDSISGNAAFSNNRVRVEGIHLNK